MKTAKPSPGTKITGPKKTTTEELKTDFPLSEKDEVKQAEKNLKEAQKKKS